MKKILLLKFLFAFFIFAPVYSQDNLAHEDTVRTIAFSPDGKLIISGGDDYIVRVWDVKEARMRNSFKHGYPINKIFIHPKGNLMITGNGNFHHCLWDLENGKVLKCFTDQQQVEGFMPDGKHIIVVEYGNDGECFATIGLISVENYKRSELFHKIYVDSLIQEISFTSDWKNIIVVSGKSMLVLNKGNPSLEIKHTLKEETQTIALSPDNKFFVQQGSSQVSDLLSGKAMLELEESISSSSSTVIKYSRDGKSIVTILNKEIKTFKTDSGKVEKKLFLDKTFLFKISPDLKRIAYSEGGKDLKIRNIEDSISYISFIAPDILRKISYRNYLKGVRSYNDKKYEEAIRFFTLALENKNSHKKIYYYRGESFLHKGQFEKAISDFLADEKRELGRSSYNLARAYCLNKDFDKAIEFLNRNQNSSYRKISDVLLKDNSFAGLRNDPRWINLINNQNKNFEKFIGEYNEKLFKGDIPSAKELINHAIQDDPENPECYKMRAELHIRTGEYDKAIRDLRKELQLDSNRFGEVFHKIAIAYVKKGDIGKASVMLKEIARADSSQFHLLLDLAEMEIMRYNRKKALEYINNYLEVMSDDYEAYYLRADMLGGREAKMDIEKAIYLCKQQGHGVPKTYYDLLNTLK